MTLCRDVEGGVEWAKVRTEMDGIIAQAALDLEITDEAAGDGPDPEMWGRTPAQAEAQRRAMGMSGGA